MSTIIHQRVEMARNGENPYVIGRVKSGWVVIGDVQPLKGYCLLLPDPVVSSINDLDEKGRSQFSLDMYKIGDAVMSATGAWRINYEILGNLEPALHAHIIPRFSDEEDELRVCPAMSVYDWGGARKFDAEADAALIATIRSGLT